MKSHFQVLNPLSDHSLRRQLLEACRYKEYIDEASERYGFQSSLIAGLGSRESHWGLLLKPTGPAGTGDFNERRYPARFRNGPLPSDSGGFGRGLMQIDYDYHEFARTGNWKDPRENILYGVKVLYDAKIYISHKTDLAGTKLLRAAVAAYNAGAGRILKAIRKGYRIDHYTTSGDYSKDVLDRAEFFLRERWE